MKKFAIIALSATFVLSLASAAMAQPAAGERGRFPATGMGRGERLNRPTSGPAQERWRQLMDELNLTPEQRQQIRPILQEQRKAVAAWQDEHGQQLKALREQMAEAVRNKDKEKIEQLRKQMEELGKSRKALHDSLLEKLSKVLTPDQMAKVRQNFAPKERHPALMRGLAALRQLDLTEEQRAQTRQIMEDARQKAQQASSPDDKARIMKEAWDKITKDVLTDAQRKKLETLRAEGPQGPFKDVPGLNLTDEQKAKIRQIIQPAREEAAKAATHEAKRDILQTAMKKIVNDVLTEKQREQWKKWREDHPRAAGPRGPASRPAAGKTNPPT